MAGDGGRLQEGPGQVQGPRPGAERALRDRGEHEKGYRYFPSGEKAVTWQTQVREITETSAAGWISRAHKGGAAANPLVGGETRGGSSAGPPEPHRSSPPFGTIAITKGNLASRQVPFFRILGPSG